MQNPPVVLSLLPAPFIPYITSATPSFYEGMIQSKYCDIYVKYTMRVFFIPAVPAILLFFFLLFSLFMEGIRCNLDSRPGGRIAEKVGISQAHMPSIK